MKVGINKRVYCPEEGEFIDVSSGTNSFRIGLGDEVMQRVVLRDVKGYQLAWVEGKVDESLLVSQKHACVFKNLQLYVPFCFGYL